ncbi:hypothetical protein GW17_00057075 [Ensete ventricosum]|nr:hypothetical protein GW17_00057075 [Ensete ventricosum]
MKRAGWPVVGVGATATVGDRLAVAEAATTEERRGRGGHGYDIGGWEEAMAVGRRRRQWWLATGAGRYGWWLATAAGGLQYFRPEWSAHPMSFALLSLSDGESKLVGKLKGILPNSWALKDMIEAWLVEAGLGLVPRSMIRPFVVVVVVFFLTNLHRSSIMIGMDLCWMKKASASGSAGQPPQPTAEATPTMRVFITSVNEHPSERIEGASVGKHPTEGSSEPPSRKKKYLARKIDARSVMRAQVGNTPLKLCEMGSWSGKDKYFTTRMTGLPVPETGAPMMARWDDLSVPTLFWNDGEITVAYTRGVLHSTIMIQHYGSLSEELVDRAMKSVV